MGRSEGQPWDQSEEGLRPVLGGRIDRGKAGTCGLLVNQEEAEGRAWREERGLRDLDKDERSVLNGVSCPERAVVLG